MPDARPAPVPPDSLFAGAFAGARVLLTGHTGFKGAWLTLWLQRLGAQVLGYALPAGPADLFTRAAGHVGIDHVEADLRDRAALAEAFRRHAPEIVIHMAAQALVGRSYEDPTETWEVNVMGTVNVLEAARACPSVRAVLVVSSDKCYENPEWPHAFREVDPMGGIDPYSASKGATELVAASYRRALFTGDGPGRPPIALATARAGNVIGGGDWAAARIVPDCMRALAADVPIVVRTPGAVRPWQHVLEPLSGYLWLTAELRRDPARFGAGWNFGPEPEAHVPVREVVDGLVARWGSGRWDAPYDEGAPRPHEAHTLRLDVTKARTLLGWRPLYGLDRALAATAAWYRAAHADPAFDARAFTCDQIADYERAAAAAGLAWAAPAQVGEGAGR